ncbi:MAG TPA: hypothetical protein VHZ03_30020 [Trebonia sp.]|nr:hypothetical protein [Trebonia sp.]
MSARWERTPDRTTWCASTGSTVMAVTRVNTGLWVAMVDSARSPELATRLTAERWAENQAGAK